MRWLRAGQAIAIMLAGAGLLSGCSHTLPYAYYAPYSTGVGSMVDGNTHF
jgi:hypothetical protein